MVNRLQAVTTKWTAKSKNNFFFKIIRRISDSEMRFFYFPITELPIETFF